MDIRFASDRDKEAIKDMIKYCFTTSEEYAQFFVENVFKAENCIGCYDGERLGAALHVYPLRCFSTLSPFLWGYRQCGYPSGVQALPLCC